MASITIKHTKEGMSANRTGTFPVGNNAEGFLRTKTFESIRSYLGNTASIIKAENTFIDPAGNEIVVPPRSRILDVINSEAEAKGLVKANGNDYESGLVAGYTTDGYLGLYEKDHYLKAIEAKAISSKVRNSKEQNYVDENGQVGQVDAPASEWDAFVLSFSDNMSKEDRELVLSTVIEELRKPTPNVGKGSQLGINGKRPIMYSREHDDTGNFHYHIEVHRHAYDPQTKEVSNSVNLGVHGVQQSQYAALREALAKEGYTDLMIYRETEKGASIGQATPEIDKEAANLEAEEQGLVRPEFVFTKEPETLAAPTGDLTLLERSERADLKLIEQERKLRAESMAREREASERVKATQEAKLMLAGWNAMEVRTINAENTAKEYQAKNGELITENTAVKSEINDFKKTLSEALAEEDLSPELTLPEVTKVLVDKLEQAETGWNDEEAEHKKTKEALTAEQTAHATTKVELDQATTLNDTLSEDNEKLVKKVGEQSTTISTQEAQIIKMQQELEKLADMVEARDAALAKATEEAKATANVERTLRNVINAKTGYQSESVSDAVNHLVGKYSDALGKKVEAEQAKALAEGAKQIADQNYKQLQTSLDSVKEELKAERADKQTLREEHRAEVTQLKTEHRKDIEELKADFKNSLKEAVDAVKSELETERAGWKAMEEQLLRQIEQISGQPQASSFNPTKPGEVQAFNPDAPGPQSGQTDYEKELDRLSKEHKAKQQPNKSKDDPNNEK